MFVRILILASMLAFFNPAGLKDDAREVSDRITERFVTTPHRWFRESEPIKRITYSEAVTWAGALRIARLEGNEDALHALKARYDSLCTERPDLVTKPVHVDHSVFGIIPLELFISTREEKYLAQGLRYADAQWGEPGWEKYGKSSRTALYDSLSTEGLSWQSRFWVDDMYMVTILQLTAWRATGEEEYLLRAAHQMRHYISALEQPGGLYFHGAQAPYYWARGNGWAAAGMADVLMELPEDNLNYEYILAAYRRMMAALKTHQSPEGSWRQLIDGPDSRPESSGTAMFTYALLTGLGMGWLSDDEYGECTLKAWEATKSFLAPDGDMTSVCEGTGKRDNRQWYLDRKFLKGDYHGQAPALWCAERILALCARPVPAFPGAEGGGMFASGGRGGRVLVVDKLSDDGSEGTLRWAVGQEGPRIVVFATGGLIELGKDLWIKNPDITIAGQTAPAPGICIKGYTTHVAADNVIIRYMRFRMGGENKAGTEEGDVLTGKYDRSRIIIDHCSISWGTDENASFYTNSDFTMQWCIISEALRLAGHSKGAHGFGGIWGGCNASFHHNLLAHNDNRNPRFDPGRKAGKRNRSKMLSNVVDFRNNVIYNWGRNVAYGGEAMKINLVGNYYKAGQASSADGKLLGLDCETEKGSPIRGVWGKVYLDGNIYDVQDGHTSRTTLDNVKYGLIEPGNERLRALDKKERKALVAKEPLPCTAVTTQDAHSAYEAVLDCAGCSNHRDRIDSRIVDEVRTRSAHFHGSDSHNGIAEDKSGFNWKSKGYPKPGIIDSPYDTQPQLATADWNPWSCYKSSGKAPRDSDGDGMPDKWEKDHGLDPHAYNPASKDLDPGYDNIEVYINSII